jgi:aspartyl-tRNA(Asn)/glutamyl-tRNA(Gln) amidotransferase subunit A
VSVERWASAWEVAAAVRAGEVAALAVTEAALARAADDREHAWLRLAPDAARAAAAAVDAARARGERPGPLAGVPVGLKDNLVTADLETTAGSRILAGWRPPVDGAAAARLRAAGAVILGKLALDEFAMGSSGEHTPFTPPRNPWARDRVPGGSSSGPAAAVAAGTACAAVASDTGGSIRQPASLCGVVGLRPTWGRVSRRGLVAYASSLDQVGPVTRDVRDAALLLACLSGHDPEDSTSLAAPTPDLAAAVERGRAAGLAGLRVGVDPALLAAPELDPDVRAGVAAAVAALAGAGATLVEVRLPASAPALAAYRVIACAEAASNLARYDGVRYGLRVAGDDVTTATRAAGLGAEVQRRILLGSEALRTGLHARAREVRAAVARGYDLAFGTCDVLAGPVAPTPAFRLGELVDDPQALAGADVFTVAAALAGLPAISVPAGRTPARADRPALPFGLQLTAPRGAEATLLRAAAGFEAARPWRAEGDG